MRPKNEKECQKAEIRRIVDRYFRVFVRAALSTSASFFGCFSTCSISGAWGLKHVEYRPVTQRGNDRKRQGGPCKRVQAENGNNMAAGGSP